VRRWAGRTAFVHVRDVRGGIEDFVETFPDDGQTDMLAAFRAHQRLDRGFGPSPGTQAAAALGAGLARAGWDVRVEPADWAIPASDAAMVRVMVDGIAEAAAHTHADPAAVERWRARRGGGLVVGHADLFAIP
jgi:hypothetical protein